MFLRATHRPETLAAATKILIVEYYKKYRRCYVKAIITLDAKTVNYDQEYSVLKSGTTANDDVRSTDQPLESCSIPVTLSVPTQSGEVREVEEIKVFVCKKMMYIWDEESESFYRLQGLDTGTGESYHQHRGLSWPDQVRRRLVYGENSIIVPITPIHKLLFLEALNPFYIFQLFSVILWFCDNYVYYASVIVVTSVFSLISEVYQMHRNQMTLSSTIHSSDIVEVVRENENTELIPSAHLVPGDVLVLPPQGCVLQCDAVLLQGNCIVNESMLTGESVPVTKTPISSRPDQLYSDKDHNRHTLYSGTEVIQTRYYGGERVTAVVIRTGFLTSKGSLVRSIMYPPPVDFKFQQDSYKFIGVLACIASFGFIYTVVTKHRRGVSAREIALDAFDLITIAVPPALPMAMTVGILYALQRLKRQKIFCISPRSINISGVLNCICFDKTGTLTEDGLDMRGVVGVNALEGKKQLDQLTVAGSLEEDHLLFCMASCHSITIINQKMVGDPLDLKMFEATGWIFDEPGADDTNKYDQMMPSVVRPSNPDIVTSNKNIETRPGLEIGLLRQFPFSSSLQRMSVITRQLGAPNFNLYCKGSPEMIASLSKEETLPSNFTEVLLEYTQQGYRVLALAWSPLKLTYTKAQRIHREEVEADLQFLGLLVLENRLKMETTPIITQLREAKIRTLMVTGDNMLTALSVGRECGIVGRHQNVISLTATLPQQGLPATVKFLPTSGQKPFQSFIGSESVHIALDEDPTPYCLALDGKSWAVIHTYFPDILQKLLVRGVIFSRMNPDQKQQLVMELQGLGYYVGMCGDGANDCGALKAAHAGISLSEAEASVASSFTSHEANIACVPTLICEGRAALVTSFGIFKYMASYSLTQFISIMILYSIDSNITDFQFLHIDLFLITVFAVLFGRTESYKGPLAAYSPPASLISIVPLMSIFLHISIVIFFQTFSFFYVQQQPWFVPFNFTGGVHVFPCYENYSVFSLSQFQYIILAVVFSRGPPFRQPIYTNFFLLGSLFIMTAFCILLTVSPPEFLINFFELLMPPSDDSDALFFRWEIIFFSAANCALAVFIEFILIDYILSRKCKNKFHNIEKSKKKYLLIEQGLKRNKAWPPMFASEGNQSFNSMLPELPLNPSMLKESNLQFPQSNGHAHSLTTLQSNADL